MTKKELRKIKGLLYGIGLGVMSISITGCAPDPKENILKYLEKNDYQEKNVGIIKNGEEFIPYYKYDQRFLCVARGYYNSKTGEYIGDSNEKNIQSKNQILYAEEQIISFIECNPNVEYNYAAMSFFTEETYENLAESYFENHLFYPTNLGLGFSIYEIKNLTTNEICYVIGRQLTGTQVFNFETYILEDYTGCAITEIEMTYDKEAYSYQEILDLIKNYRENEMTLSLEK